MFGTSEWHTNIGLMKVSLCPGFLSAFLKGFDSVSWLYAATVTQAVSQLTACVSLEEWISPKKWLGYSRIGLQWAPHYDSNLRGNDASIILYILKINV